MTKDQIKVGGLYRAKVSNKLVTVRVDAIRVIPGYTRPFGSKVKDTTVYDVTNLTTGRTTSFRSAAKFQSVVEG